MPPYQPRWTSLKDKMLPYHNTTQKIFVKNSNKRLRNLSRAVQSRLLHSVRNDKPAYAYPHADRRGTLFAMTKFYFFSNLQQKKILITNHIYHIPALSLRSISSIYEKRHSRICLITPFLSRSPRLSKKKDRALDRFFEMYIIMHCGNILRKKII